LLAWICKRFLGTQNPESRCVQQLQHEGGNECIRYQSHFKCLVPAQGIVSCETIRGCGLGPEFDQWCGTEEKQVCTDFDDWSEEACREHGEFEEWETCVEWSKPTPVGACLTEATITIHTVFDAEEVENHTFGKGNVRNYNAALEKMQKIAEDEINREFTAVASYPVDPYGKVVKEKILLYPFLLKYHYRKIEDHKIKHFACVRDCFVCLVKVWLKIFDWHEKNQNVWLA